MSPACVSRPGIPVASEGPPQGTPPFFWASFRATERNLRKLGEKCNDGINYIRDYIDKTLNRKAFNNIYQENDIDAPDDTVNVKVVKEVKKVEGKDKKIMKKIYLLNDTSCHVVEIEEN